MTINRKKPEAVILGSGLNALGVARSLACEGIRVTLVDESPGGPAAHSRFVVTRPYRSHEGQDLLSHLLALASRFERPPTLFPTQEAMVALLSENRHHIDGKFLIVFPDAQTLAALMDKSRFQVLAHDRGFPVPRSTLVQRMDDLARAAPLTYPCILKPAVKNEAWERRYKKAYRFETFTDLAAFCASLHADTPEMIVQEWIEGTDSDVYFTLVYRDAAGKTCASFTGRKIRQWPPLVGGTASCMPAPEVADELHDLTTRFFDAVGFIGMGSMEYKREPRSDRFVMVEPTVGRTDFQEEVATLNGVNIVRAAYRSLAGLPPVPDAQVTRARLWRDVESEERSKQAIPDAAEPPGAARAQVVDALFRTSDPGPWLADVWARAATRLGLPS